MITTEDIEGTSDRFTITYKELYKDVKPGGFILVNDGQVELLVDHVEGTDIVCVCANDGKVKNKRGINVPGIELGFDFISEKDTSLFLIHYVLFLYYRLFFLNLDNLF